MMSLTRAAVLAALEEERAWRALESSVPRPAILHPLRSLAPLALDADMLAVTVPPRDDRYLEPAAATPVAVERELLDEFPLLPQLWADDNPEDGKGFLVAGGAVTSGVLCRHTCGDVDIFAYGFASTQEATAALTRAVARFEAAHASKREDVPAAKPVGKTGKPAKPLPAAKPTPLRITLSKHCLAVMANDCRTKHGCFDTKYEFVLRLYATREEVLLGFDLPVCAVGFYREGGQAHVVMSPLARLALQSGCNFYLPERASPSFARRHAKYYERHFALAFPEVTSLEAVMAPQERKDWEGSDTTRRGVKLPPKTCHAGSRLSVAHVEKTSSYTHNTTVRWYVESKTSDGMRAGEWSDYNEAEPCFDDKDVEAARLLCFNFGCLVSGRLDSLVWQCEPPDADAPEPFMERLCLPGMEPEDWEPGAGGTLSRLFRRVCKRWKRVAEGRNVHAYPSSLCNWTGELFSKAQEAANAGAVARLKAVLADVWALARERTLAARTAIQWLTENPGAQHTSSFHPRPSTAEETYGAANVFAQGKQERLPSPADLQPVPKSIKRKRTEEVRVKVEKMED